MSTNEATALLNDSPLLKSDDGGHKYVKREGVSGAYKYTYADGSTGHTEHKPTFALAAQPHQQGLFGASSFEKKPKPKPVDPEAHRQTDMFAPKPAAAAPAPAPAAPTPSPAKAAPAEEEEHPGLKKYREHRDAAEQASSRAGSPNAEGHHDVDEHVTAAFLHRKAAASASDIDKGTLARHHELAAADHSKAAKHAVNVDQARSASDTAHESDGAVASHLSGGSFDSNGSSSLMSAVDNASHKHHLAADARKTAGFNSGGHKVSAAEHGHVADYGHAAGNAHGSSEFARKNPESRMASITASEQHAEAATAARKLGPRGERLAKMHDAAAAAHGPAGAGPSSVDRIKDLASKAKADTSYATAKLNAEHASNAFDAGRGQRTKRELNAAAQNAHTAHATAAKAAHAEGKHDEASKHESSARAYGDVGGKKAKKKPGPTHAAKTAEAMEAKESFDDAAAKAAEKIPTNKVHMVDTPAGPRESTPGGLPWRGDAPHNPGALKAAREAYGSAKSDGKSDTVAHGKANKAAQKHLKTDASPSGVVGAWDHATHAQKLHNGESGATVAADAPKSAKKGSRMGFDRAVKRYGGDGMSPASIAADKASQDAEKDGSDAAHKAARDAHEAAASFHGNRRKPDDYDSDVEEHHLTAAEMHTKRLHAVKSITVEATLLKSQDRTAGPPPRGGVYDGLASGMIDPTVDRPRYAGRAPNQVIAVGVDGDSNDRNTFAYQKGRQQGATLDLTKSAIIGAVKDGYRMQLMAAADANPVVALIMRGRVPGERPTVPVELRKSVQLSAPDPDAVVAFAAAALKAASDRNPDLKRGLSRLGVSRATLYATLEALALTPAGMTAGNR